MGIFVNQEKMHPHLVFSPFWGENILVGSGTKHSGPTQFFSLPSLKPNTYQKCSSFFFFFFFSFSLKSTQPNTPFLCFSLSLLNCTFHRSSLSMCLAMSQPLITKWPNGLLCFNFFFLSKAFPTRTKSCSINELLTFHQLARQVFSHVFPLMKQARI